MEFDGRSQWVGPDYSRAAPPFSPVAEVSRAETTDREVAEPLPRQARVGPAAARDLAKNKVVQLRACIGSDGWHGGAGSAGHQDRTGEGQVSFQEASFERGEIEEARKFITRSVRRLKEMEEECRVEERLSEAQYNLEKMSADQETCSSHQPPQDVTSQVTDLQQMVNGEHVAGRARHSGCRVAISREDAAGGEVAPSTEFSRGS